MLFMKNTKSKVCNKRIMKTVEEQYYPASFLDRVNLLYYMNARKKEIENETKISQNSK
tara:strand:+ start:487 stop:660 length:174 start_codon:yes stop_codon:yes gene_type:complete